MPRRNLKDDGKSRSATKAAVAPRGRAQLPPVTQAWLEATGQVPASPPGALAVLDLLLVPHYGRYSVNRDSNGTAYHKFRWQSGALAGRYVMYTTAHGIPLEEGLLGLVDKMHAAEEGRQHATLDRYM